MIYNPCVLQWESIQKISIAIIKVILCSILRCESRSQCFTNDIKTSCRLFYTFVFPISDCKYRLSVPCILVYLCNDAIFCNMDSVPQGHDDIFASIDCRIITNRCELHTMWMQWIWLNSPVSQWFSTSGEQPEQRVLAYALWQPTSGCIAIFHKYCCFTKEEGIIAKLTLQNPWGYITDVSKYHNAGIWSMD